MDQPYKYDSHVYVRVRAVTGKPHKYQSSDLGSPNRSQFESFVNNIESPSYYQLFNNNVVYPEYVIIIHSFN